MKNNCSRKKPWKLHFLILGNELIAYFLAISGFSCSVSIIYCRGIKSYLIRILFSVRSTSCMLINTFLFAVTFRNWYVYSWHILKTLWLKGNSLIKANSPCGTMFSTLFKIKLSFAEIFHIYARMISVICCRFVTCSGKVK